MAIRGILPLARYSTRAVPRPVQTARLARSYATSKQPSTTVRPRAAVNESTSQLTSCRQSQFYKTFTRPVAKVLVLAVFTYQVVYWSWVRLEADEVRAETDGEWP